MGARGRMRNKKKDPFLFRERDNRVVVLLLVKWQLHHSQIERRRVPATNSNSVSDRRRLPNAFELALPGESASETSACFFWLTDPAEFRPVPSCLGPYYNPHVSLVLLSSSSWSSSSYPWLIVLFTTRAGHTSRRSRTQDIALACLATRGHAQNIGWGPTNWRLNQDQN